MNVAPEKPIRVGDQMKVPLSRPIQTPDGEVSELELRELTLGDLKGVDLTQIGDATVLVKVISKASGIPPSFVEKISARDFRPLVEVVADFLDISLPTGEN